MAERPGVDEQDAAAWAPNPGGRWGGAPEAAPLAVRWAGRLSAARGWRFTAHDPFSWSLAEVADGDSRIFVGAGATSAFAINDAAAAGVARDKAQSAAILRQAGLRVPRGGLFFVTDAYAALRPPGRGLDAALRCADALGYPVFAKPNDGSRGALAQSAADPDALAAHLRRIGNATPLALVQERLLGEERRVFAIDGVVRFAYAKTRPQLIGDGSGSLRALLEAEDARRRAQGLPPLNRADPILQRTVAAIGGWDAVPALGRPVAISETANVSGGGGVSDLRRTATAFEADLAARVFQAVGLRAVAIDLIAPPSGREADSVVLELNANPSFAALEAAGAEVLLAALWTEVFEKGLAARRSAP